jgi:N6-L-threonylcarbamoyladenine synthase
MRILGIETSCDETAAAILDGRKVLASLVATQHDVHARYGGVVPELASRRHIENIIPLIRGALDEAKLTTKDIEGVAVTFAPGLVGSLLVGLAAAKGIAYATGLPLVGVNHLEGHLNAAALEFGDLPLPYVGLVVSGGHTSLYLVRNFGHYQLLGATRDDAAGEAFDKVDPETSLDFSFSGIKTAVLLLHRSESRKAPPSEAFVTDMAASFQEATVNFLVDRLMEAARIHRARAVVIAGGVAANRRLRTHLSEEAKQANLPCFIPSMDLCTDNAAMIAFVGGRYLAEGKKSDLMLNAVANQEIGI